MKKMFGDSGFINFTHNNYDFTLTPGQWILCRDPDGFRASLCIHTMGLSCDPIDEIVIAYLHIVNEFDGFMKKSIVHNAEKGFRIDKKEKTIKKVNAEQLNSQFAY